MIERADCECVEAAQAERRAEEEAVGQMADAATRRRRTAELPQGCSRPSEAPTPTCDVLVQREVVLHLQLALDEARVASQARPAPSERAGTSREWAAEDGRAESSR